MNSIIKQDFEGQLHSFDADGWFNATEAAKRFGQKAHEWLRLPSTERYMAALAKALGGKEGFSRFDLVRAQRGTRSRRDHSGRPLVVKAKPARSGLRSRTLA